MKARPRVDSQATVTGGRGALGDHVEGDKVAGDKVGADKVAGDKHAPHFSSRAPLVYIAGDNHSPLLQDAATAARHQPIHQLPTTPADFVGRRAELRKIDRWAKLGPRTVINICGRPGSGKSVLAVQAARLLASAWSDAEIYIDLRSDGEESDIAEVLAGLLVILGLPASEVPQGVGLRSAMLRSQLASKRVVLVIDNAVSSEQVAPLLPGSGEWRVIVTSWTYLSELGGARQMTLNTLDDESAAALLTAIGRRPLAASDQANLVAILEWCDRLPLAIRIAGGVLRARPHWGWSDLSRLLQDAQTGKIGKSIDAQVNQPSFKVAYDNLSQESALALRLLALTPTRVIPRDLSQTLLRGMEYDDVMDDLIVRQLIEPATGGAVRMHDLLSLFAQQRSEEADSGRLRADVLAMVTDWTIRKLGVDYPRKLSEGHSHLPSVLPLPELLETRAHYLDIPIRLRDGLVAPVNEVFPEQHRRLLIQAPGGSGKTTLVNQLCLTGGERLLAGEPTHVPFLVLARDTPPGAKAIDLLSLVRQTLRYRYTHDVTDEALQHIFSTGRGLLIIDGLDEIPDTFTREALVSAIEAFVGVFPHSAMLVTARPSFPVSDMLPGFARSELTAWSRKLRREYAEKLSALDYFGRRVVDIVSSLEDTGQDQSDLLATPLGFQLAVRSSSLHARVAFDQLEMVRDLVEGSLQREYVRGTAPHGPDLRLLGYAAFMMQAHPTTRTMMSRSALSELLSDYARQIEGMDLKNRGALGWADGRRTWSTDDLISTMSRGSILVEVGASESGEPMYGFTHNLFREYLAAAHLADQSPGDVAHSVSIRSDDEAWGPVFRMALRIIQRTRGAEAARQVFNLLDGASLTALGVGSIDDLD